MSKITNCLIKKDKTCNPIWFMRQAGRHLPEFRKIRKKNKNFIKLCFNSKLSSELTLQPMKRYDLDAAIIFSDILIIPYVLGQKINFTKLAGPRLDNFDLTRFNHNGKNFSLKLKPIYNAIKITRKKLNKKKSLISFIGAPWTLLVYMLNLKTSQNKLNLKNFNSNKKKIKLLTQKLINFLCTHIEEQHKSGSDIVQIFDSWAGLIPEKYLKDLCFNPTKKIVNFCKKKNIPVICFPKGLNKKYKSFVDHVKPNGISIDYEIKPSWARANLKNICIQGGLNPKYLLGNEKLLEQKVKEYLNIFSDVPYIFNLGHGLLPETNPVILNKLIKKVKEFKNER